MTKTLHGTVKGSTIQLNEDLGLAEGQEVQVQVRPIRTVGAGNGLQRCAGALSDEWTEEDDRILEQIRRDRKLDTRREISK